MSFHAVRRIVHELALPDGRVQASLELQCGCLITRRLDEHRLFTADDGARLAVGKYPCVQAHPVARPVSGTER